MTQKIDLINSLIGYYTKGNKAEFARILGIKPQTLSTWLVRNTCDIELIYSKCEGINPEWLLTGKGNMLKSDIKKESSCESVESLKELLKAKEEIIELQRKLINSLENKNATNSGSVKVNSDCVEKRANG